VELDGELKMYRLPRSNRTVRFDEEMDLSTFGDRMDTIWLSSRVVDGALHLSSKPNEACLIRDTDSLSWAKELFELDARYECDVVSIDLSRMDFISHVAVKALERLAATLERRSGTLLIGGVRLHVLAIFLALAPRLEASNDPVVYSTVRTLIAA
jgi:hypothetical protein